VVITRVDTTYVIIINAIITVSYSSRFSCRN